jgi:cytochrome bd-type quinol oxidase subunit 2
MLTLREKSYFKIVAIVLSLCFAFFIMHSVMHLEEHMANEGGECSVCFALSYLSIIFSAIFILLAIRQQKRLAIKATQFHFSYLDPYIKLLAGRAPPFSI